jgi:hypothetical protein
LHPLPSITTNAQRNSDAWLRFLKIITAVCCFWHDNLTKIRDKTEIVGVNLNLGG